MARRITASTLVILIITAATVFTLSACADRTPIGGEEFTSLAEQSGFTVSEWDGFFGEENTETALLAAEPDGKFTLEFYVFTTDAHARSAFDETNTMFGSMSGTWTRTEINAANYNIFKGTHSGVYYAAVRIGATMLYVETESENKTAVNEILDTLGYK